MLSLCVKTANILIQINEGVYPNIERDCTCVIGYNRLILIALRGHSRITELYNREGNLSVVWKRNKYDT